MSKPTITDSLSSLEKKGAIEAALAGDMEPVDIFTAILQNVYGITERKRVVVEWGRKIGLQPSESLRIAQGASLIPTTRAPRESGQEKPQRKKRERTSE
jgi:hypothetical protein